MATFTYRVVRSIERLKGDERKMKVAAVVVLYGGCFDRLEVFLTTGKARKRYKEIMKEYDLGEDKTRGSDYSVALETELIVK